MHIKTVPTALNESCAELVIDLTKLVTFKKARDPSLVLLLRVADVPITFKDVFCLIPVSLYSIYFDFPKARRAVFASPVLDFFHGRSANIGANVYCSERPSE